MQHDLPIQYGVWPEPRLIPLDAMFLDLATDSGYQRTPKKKDLNRMGPLIPALTPALMVSERPNGKFAIVDGGHRWVQAKEMTPRPDSMPAQVIPVDRFLTQAEEATLFLQANVGKSLSAWSHYTAALCSGAGWAADLDGAYTRFGYAPVEHANKRQAHDPVQIGAHRVMENMVKAFGVDSIHVMLEVLRETYYIDPLQTDESMLYAYGHMIGKRIASGNGVDKQVLVSLFKPEEAYAAAQTTLSQILPTRKGDGGGKRELAARELRRRYIKRATQLKIAA